MRRKKVTIRHTVRLEKKTDQCAEEKAARRNMNFNQYIEYLILEDCKNGK